MSDSVEEVHDIDIIAQMLKAASKEGMEVEVVWSFANEIQSGQHNYAIAAATALYEWDI
jgi:hypothetical protein